MKRLLFLLCLLCTYFNIGLSASQITKTWTTAEGLSGMVISKIYKSPKGYIWLGVSDRLDRFDGVYVKKYEMLTPSGRNQGVVNDIVEVAGGDLYVGTDDGLWRLDNYTDSLSQVYPKEIFGVEALVSIGNTLYVGTKKGLYLLADNTMSFIPVDHKAISSVNHIMDIYVRSKDEIWIATQKGLVLFSTQSRQMEQLDGAISDIFIKTLTGIDDKLFLGTRNNGLLCYDLTRKVCTPYIDLECNEICEVSTDGIDLLYVATNGNGAYVISTMQHKIIEEFKRHESDAKSLPENSVYSFLCDDQQNYWFGLYYGGLCFSQHIKQLFNIYTCGDFSTYNLPIRSFCFFGDERVIGTRNGLYFINEKSKKVIYYGHDKLRSNIVTSVCRLGMIYYIGTYGGGLLTLDSQTAKLEPLNNMDIPINATVNSIVVHRNMIWMGVNESVLCYDPASKESIVYNSRNSQLKEGLVSCLFFDHLGRGWISTRSGLSIFDPNDSTIKSNIFPADFPANMPVYQMTEDLQGNVILVTSGAIFQSNSNITSWRQLDYPDLRGNFRFWQEDRFCNQWIATEGGLYLYDNKGNIKRKFNRADNLPDLSFTSNNPYIDDNGLLWLGNRKGLLYLSTASESINDKDNGVAKLMLSSVYIDNVPLIGKRSYNVHNEYKLELNNGEDKIYLRPVLMDYSMEEYNYEYRLDGIDTEWSTVSNKNPIFYGGLRSGEYKLTIRIKDTPHISSSWDIVVLRSWYRSRLFYLILVILLIVAGIGVIYAREAVWQSLRGGCYSVPFTTKASSVSPDGKYKLSRISDQERTMIQDKLLQYLEIKKPYLNAGLKLSDVAKVIGCSSHNLSLVLSLHIKQNYYDLINSYRLAEFKLRIEDSQYDKYNISALAELCGFSRTSFYNTFKRVEGVAPTEYLKSRGLRYR